MLVITRKTGERICIGDDVTVTVLDVAGSSARLGIEAPGDVRVYRYEIWVQVQEENRAAAQASIEDLPST